MGQMSSTMQNAIEVVEALPPDEHDLIAEVLYNRMIERKRSLLVSAVSEARAAFVTGKVERGGASDLLAEIDK